MRTRRHPRLVAGIAVVAACTSAIAVSAAPASAVGSDGATTLAATTTAPTIKVLTIGDSIMNGYGLAQGEDWPSLLGDAENWSVTNAACDGAGVLQIGNSHECDSDFAGIIDSDASLQPDIVIFEGSSNDFGLDDDDLLTATISELQTIKADFPNAQIVGLSTLWGYTDPPTQLADINSQVRQAVEQVGGTYIDLGQPFSGHPELMQASDVHPTAAGQALIASALETAIQPVVLAVAKARADASGVVRLGDLDRLRTAPDARVGSEGADPDSTDGTVPAN